MGEISSNDGFIANSNAGNKNKIYKGSERRKYNRRREHDRRAMIRFEPGTLDRRAYKDRRSSEVWNGRGNF